MAIATYENDMGEPLDMSQLPPTPWPLPKLELMGEPTISEQEFSEYLGWSLTGFLPQLDSDLFDSWNQAAASADVDLAGSAPTPAEKLLIATRLALYEFWAERGGEGLLPEGVTDG